MTVNDTEQAWRVQTGMGNSHFRTLYVCNSPEWAEYQYHRLYLFAGQKKRILDPDGRIVKREKA